MKCKIGFIEWVWIFVVAIHQILVLLWAMIVSLFMLCLYARGVGLMNVIITFNSI